MTNADIVALHSWIKDYGFKKLNDTSKEIVLSVLKKQIPKEPVNRTSWPLDCDGGNCPNCNREINQQFEYCPECGQKLEW